MALGRLVLVWATARGLTLQKPSHFESRKRRGAIKVLASLLLCRFRHRVRSALGDCKLRE